MSKRRFGHILYSLRPIVNVIFPLFASPKIWVTLKKLNHFFNYFPIIPFYWQVKIALTNSDGPSHNTSSEVIPFWLSLPFSQSDLMASGPTNLLFHSTNSKGYAWKSQISLSRNATVHKKCVSQKASQILGRREYKLSLV